MTPPEHGKSDASGTRDPSPVRWPVLVAVTVAGAVYTLAQGITYPLLAVTLEHSGASGTAIGTSAAMTPIGMVLASAGLPSLTHRLPPITVALTCFTLVAALLLGLAAVEGFWPLLGLRLTLGACLAAIFVITSTWTHQIVDERVRGRVVAAYALVLAGGFAAGPALLTLSPPRSPAPLLIAAGATALGAAAILAVHAHLPRPIRTRPPRATTLPVVAACIAVPAAVEQASLLRGLLPEGEYVSCFFVADDVAMADPERPLLVVPVPRARTPFLDEPPREQFRVAVASLHKVENNLSLANLDWADFASHTQAGVFRGF